MDPTEYHRLAQLAFRDRITFRVWDKQSSSPLRISHDPSRSGFTARHDTFRKLDQKAYQKLTQGPESDDLWMDSEVIQQITLKHVLGEQSNRKIDVSPWVSTSGSLRWVIWEIVRRLTLNHKNIIHLTIIDKSQTKPSIVTKALHRLRACQDQAYSSDGHATQRDRNRADAALERIGGTGEELWYGRIFGEAIEQDLMWSRARIPLGLPKSYFQPEYRYNQSPTSWLDNLSWDAHTDNFDAMKRKVIENMKDLKRQNLLDGKGQVEDETILIPRRWAVVVDDFEIQSTDSVSSSTYVYR